MQKDVNPAPVLVKEERQTMYAPLTQDEVMAIFRAPLTNATCVISLDQAILLDPDEYKGTAVAGHPSPSAPDMAVPVAMESPGSIPMRPSSEVGRGAEMTMDSLKGESELEVVKHRLLSNLETQSSLKRHARLDRFRKAQFFCALGDLRIHDSTSYHDPSSSMSS
ncbi:uncharacterized protein BYT42DRAFT_93951 [Radiomyces spectabilis]|uniref:uncharacterized protein n=1 Tax=Radiomyces spectabilis TaxID=64574 RepID=UPI00221F80BB|nr:uncharacterized protein BYT42DRAFT_93951 [Radiomyces spectabilis]KAI8370569.1 hypothetical protein BYT42DRAFT_93951 [Radiomyces spectabilis]